MPMLPCPKCRLFYKVKKNAVAFEEGRTVGRPDEGTFAWVPYKLWHGDLYECEGCGAQVIAGVGREPIAEHYEARYAECVAYFAPLFRIDDCMGAFHSSQAGAE